MGPFLPKVPDPPFPKEELKEYVELIVLANCLTVSREE